jgi:hypothetical protein
VDGGVLAGRSLVKKQFFKKGGFGRDFGGSRLRYIAGQAIDQWVDLVNVATLPSVVTAQT